MIKKQEIEKNKKDKSATTVAAPIDINQKIPIPIFLHGLSLGQGNFRPAMIFKDKTEREVLPVWLDPLEANLLLAEAQNNPTRQSSAHRASLKIFDALNVKLKSIYFDEVSGAQQFASMVVLQDSKDLMVKLKASEAMSLAVNAGCVFFTNRKVVEESRALTLEYLLHMERGIGISGVRDPIH